MKKENILFFNHVKGILYDEINKKIFEEMKFEILATTVTKDNKKVVAAYAHKSLPLFGVQFHPEKNGFESKVHVSDSK